MTDTRYLVHGVFWDGPAPSAAGEARVVLRLQDDAGAIREVALDAGTRLGFRVTAPGKRCLGHHKVHGPAERDYVRCAERAAAERGHQCGTCFAVDDSRLVHDFHRGGRVPAGLRAYLMQPHWLYVATFANGASKVGTAAELRKWNRLAEQGAVAARYVAAADDGRIVRLLEDLVTRDAGLPQQVRSTAKAAGIAAPLLPADVDARNARRAAGARAVLAVAGSEGYRVVDEQWRRPRLADAAAVPALRHAYPHDLGSGTHGFETTALSGSVALARLDGADLDFVVNLASLKGRTIELGQHRSEVPAVQESLF
ncbi:DUF2797 domain-containing protein [Arthrobacter sp. B3I4]|uniref:DUF2797 domain-containing protein n=1 Tax=Arthrobacter sp. B3I4 TaxID=3042267 RepID=UPI00278898EF|nr:DUF2797 domain-containing protein [Arthrobacter sp. B3I4]MDQ0755420.1 hypothetical protein [Arthrobacter sp. B3I4]